MHDCDFSSGRLSQDNLEFKASLSLHHKTLSKKKKKRKKERKFKFNLNLYHFVLEVERKPALL
jgi:hypothetical protein